MWPFAIYHIPESSAVSFLEVMLTETFYTFMCIQIKKHSDILQCICINCSKIYVSFCSLFFFYLNCILNCVLEIFLNQHVCVFIINFNRCIALKVKMHYELVSCLIFLVVNIRLFSFLLLQILAQWKDLSLLSHVHIQVPLMLI